MHIWQQQNGPQFVPIFRTSGGSSGPGIVLPTFASGYRMVGNTTQIDNGVSGANNVRQDHKRVLITETVTNSEIWCYFQAWQRSNVAAEISTPPGFDLNAAALYGGATYDFLINGTSASASVPAGGGVWAKLSGITALTAGTFLMVNTRRIYAAGTSVKIRGQECKARFGEGAAFGTNSSIDYTKNYGRGATATGTVSAGAIATITIDNTNSNGLYENTGANRNILARELQADGTIREELVGKYTVSGGNPVTNPTVDAPGSGWVNPTFVVLDQVSAFGAVTGDIYGPTFIVAIPAAYNVRSLGMGGDSNSHGSGDVAQHDNGFRGIYERAINGTRPVFQFGYSGLKASDLLTPGVSLPKTMALVNEWCQDLLMPVGTNDVPTDSAATIQTNMGTIATYFRGNGKGVSFPPIPPRTTGTFTSDAGQTITTGYEASGVADTVNAAIYANTVVCDFPFPDLRKVMQSATDANKWRSDAGAIYTDGTHPSQLGHVVGGNALAARNMPRDNLVFDIDVSNGWCYGGTGQTIRNLCQVPADGSARSAYDLVLGATSGSSTDDPTFNGTAGLPGCYFNYDGGDVITLAGAMTSFLNNLHKTTGGQAFTVVALFRAVDSANGYPIWATNSASSGIGFNVLPASNENVTINQRGDASQAQVVTGTILTAGTDYVVAVAYNAGGGAGSRRWINNRTATSFTHTFNATSANASGVLAIGRFSGGSTAVDANWRFYGLVAYAGQANDTTMGQIIDAANARNAVTFA